MEYHDFVVNKGHRHQQQIPSFGNWEYYDDIPVTQYFESARQAGLVRSGRTAAYACHAHYYAPGDADLFRVPPSPMHYHCHHNHKPLKPPHKLNHQPSLTTSARDHRRQVRVCDADAYPRRKPKAVDQDLYKIPPELLCRRRRPNKVPIPGFWSCCLGFNCNTEVIG